MANGARSARALWLVFGGVALVNLALLRSGIVVIDGDSMFAVAHSLATTGHLQISCHLHGAPVGMPGRGGQCYSPWYPLLSVAAVPFVWLGMIAAVLVHLPALQAERVAVLVVPAVAAAGAAAFTAALALRLGATRPRAVLAAAIFAFATEAFTYSRSFFADTLCALFVAIAVWSLGRPRQLRWLGGLALALAVLAKPQMVVVGPAIALALAFGSRRWRGLFAPIVGSGVGGILYLAYNWLRFGSVFDFGRHAAHFSPTHLPVGLALLVVSPGRGLLWYSPVAIVGAFLLWKMRHHPTALASLIAALAILLEYALKVPLGGGYDWGTRLLIPALPLLCAPIALVRGRPLRLAAIAVVVGLIVELPSTVSYFERYYETAYQSGVSTNAIVWSLPHAPLVGVWPTAWATIQDARTSNPSMLIREAGSPARGVASSQLMHGLADWWWFLPAVGIPVWVGALVAMIMISLGGLLLFKAATWEKVSIEPVAAGG